MAKIPTYDALGEPVINAERPVRTFDVKAINAPSAAFAEFGKTVSDVGIDLAARMKDDDEYETKKRFIDFDLMQEKRLDEAKRNASQDAENFTTNYRTTYDADAKTFFKDVPESKRAEYDHKLVERGAQYESNASKFEFDQRDKYHREDLDAQTQNFRNATIAKPETYKENLARGISLIESSRIPAQDKQKAMKLYAQSVEEDAIRARIANGEDVEEIIKDIDLVPKGADQSALPPVTSGRDLTNVIKVVSSLTNGNADRNIDMLKPEFAGALGSALAAMPEDLRDAIQIEQAGRSRSYQSRLRQNYLTGRGGLAAPPGRSKHEVGDAVDLGPTAGTEKDPKFQAALKWLYENGEQYGVENPKSIRNRDSGHFQANGRTPPEPVAVADRGLTQYAGLQDGQGGTATDAPDVEPEAPYRHLRPEQRRTLSGIAREAARTTLASDIDNDIEQIRNTGKPRTRPDGRTSIERGIGILTDNQLAEKEEKWKEAELEYEAISPLGNMSEDDALEHIGSVLPDDDDDDYAIRARVARKADLRRKAIVKARQKDPALSVQEAPEVREAFDTLKRIRTAPNAVDGGAVDVSPLISPVKANEIVIEARIAAQRRVGLSEGEISPITKKQAMALIQIPDFKALSDIDLPKALREARDRSTEMYGPKYSKMVFEKAVGMLSSTQRTRDMAGPIIRKMVDGDPVTPADYSMSDALAKTSYADILFAPPESAEIARGAMMTPVSDPVTAPSFAKAKSADKKTAPPPEAVSWLKENPALHVQFDKKYGPGAAAAALRK